VWTPQVTVIVRRKVELGPWDREGERKEERRRKRGCGTRRGSARSLTGNLLLGIND